MVDEPSREKQLSQNHMCKIGFMGKENKKPKPQLSLSPLQYALVTLHQNEEQVQYTKTTWFVLRLCLKG
jgi:hypothetical protein